MYDDILVPSDGSEGIEDALDHALAIATPNDATVHSLYVVDSRLYRAAEAETKDDVRRTLEREGDDSLARIRDRVEAADLAALTSRKDGIPHREILGYADREGIDLVVMATHGRTGAERVASLGSTTQRVVEDGSVPVLVVAIE